MAGEHLAVALNSLRPNSFSYDLCYAQDQAVYAAANGQVPDRLAPPSGTAPTSRPAQSPMIVVRPEGSKQADVPGIVAALTTMATRLGPAAFAEAAPALLAALPEIVLAAVVIALVVEFFGKPDQEALVPPAVPPGEPGLVPPGVPGGKPEEGGFTAVPSPGQGGDAGTTPAPALPHVEEGPGVAPPMPAVLPKLTPKQEKERDDKLKKLGLPTGGEYPFIPPKGWYGQYALERGEKKGYLDAEDNEWVRPRGIRKGDEWHWDVQLKKPLPGGKTHRNVNPDGSIHH